MLAASIAFSPWVALVVGLVVGLTPSLLTAFATHGTEIRGRMLSAAADFDVLASKLMTQLRDIENLVERERRESTLEYTVDEALRLGQDLQDQLNTQNMVVQLLFGMSPSAIASTNVIVAIRQKGATLHDMRSDSRLTPASNEELIRLLRVFNDAARRDMRRPLWLKRLWIREPG